MSTVARTVGKVAGVVGAVALAAGTLGVGSIATAALLATVGKTAVAVGALANVFAQATASKPAARGNVSDIRIGANLPMPYLIGRTYAGGNLIHDVGYGPTLNKVPNPYRSFAVEYSGCGPVDGLEAVLADYAPVSFSGNAATGYFGGFLYRSAQLGAQPSPLALAGQWGPIPGWGADAKLSGHAAILFSAKFDKDGKVFASGLPQFGAVWRGVKAYDPRSDSTYPGGVGSQRWEDEATWTYTENPGLHALTYARGRYSPDGKKLFGIGLPRESIVVEDFVTLANVCDANGWKVGGVIHEPAARWTNLKDILAAGGAEPVAGGRLGLRINMPRVAVDRITDEDLATDDVSVGAMQSWRARLNGIVPRWRSEAAKWEYVPGDLVSVASYLAEDGEEKTEERQFNMVQHGPQAAQLAAYDLVNARELGPIEIVCKPRLRGYRPGTLVIVHLPEDGLVEQPAVIVQREIDAGANNFTVALTLIGETPAKHDFALGRTSVPPPTPSITGTAELDEVIREIGAPVYEDGTPIDDLRPAQPGATVGAPSGTPVGNRTSDEVNAELDARRAETEALVQTVTGHDGRITAARGAADAALDGVGEANRRIDAVTAGGDVGDLTARVQTLEAAEVDQDAAIAGVREIVEVGSDSNASLRAGLTAQRVALLDADKVIADSVTALRGTYAGNVGELSDRQTVFADALGTAVQRTRRLEAMAAVASGTDGLIDNPTFSLWPDGQEMPTGVLRWQGNEGVYRIAKPGGGNSLAFDSGLNTPAGVLLRYVEHPRLRTVRANAWYMVEIDLSLRLGDRLLGLGFYFQGVGPDGQESQAIPYGFGQGRPGGAPLPVPIPRDKLFQFRVPVRLTAAATIAANLYVMHWTVFGSDDAQGKHPSIDLVNVRPMSDAEIAGLEAGTSVAAALARLDSDEFARATALRAEAGRIDNAVSKIGGLEATSGIQQITITDLATKIAAARLTLKTAAGPGTEAEIELASDQAGGGRIRLVGAVWAGDFTARSVTTDIITVAGVQLVNLDRSTMTSTSVDSDQTTFDFLSPPGEGASAVFPGLGGTISAGAAGTIYAEFTGLRSGSNPGRLEVVIEDTATNAVLYSIDVTPIGTVEARQAISRRLNTANVRRTLRWYLRATTGPENARIGAYAVTIRVDWTAL